MQAQLLDLSHHNPHNDLGFAVACGVRAVMLKCSEGVGYFDPAYPAHLTNSESVGLEIGAYAFGTGAHPGKDQAEYFLGSLEQHGGVPDVLSLDVERNLQGPSMTLAQAEEFCDTVINTASDRKILIYGGEYLRQIITPTSSLLRFGLWLADYRKNPVVVPGWSDWTLLQFTDRNGTDPGPDPLDGYDCSAAREGDATIQALWG